jgi:hypothetical protein
VKKFLLEYLKMTKNSYLKNKLNNRLTVFMMKIYYSYPLTRT